MLHFLEGTVPTEIIWNSSAWETGFFLPTFIYLTKHLFISGWIHRCFLSNAFVYVFPFELVMFPRSVVKYTAWKVNSGCQYSGISVEN